MTEDNKKRHSDLDAPQGDGEKRTETYAEYDEGVSEQATQRSAKNASGVSSSADEQVGGVRLSLEESIQFAKKFLEDVLSFFGLNTDVYATANEDDIIELHVPSTHLNGFLIGQRGETMRALQFMTSTALRNNNHEHTRVHVDIADYKKQRAERVAMHAEEWVKKVKEDNQPMELHPMNSADRRVVHKLATESGLDTESVGEGRDRHVVLKPSEEKPAKKTNKEED